MAQVHQYLFSFLGCNMNHLCFRFGLGSLLRLDRRGRRLWPVNWPLGRGWAFRWSGSTGFWRILQSFLHQWIKVTQVARCYRWAITNRYLDLWRSLTRRFRPRRCWSRRWWSFWKRLSIAILFRTFIWLSGMRERLFLKSLYYDQPNNI